MKEKRLVGLVLGLLMCIPVGSYLLDVAVAPPVPIPSTISTQLIYENTTINQNSNITIQDGGVLVLINSELVMCSTAQTSYKITVQKGGSLFVLNQSEVRASNPNYGYDFKAEKDSIFVAELSEINDCGRDNNGIWLRTDNATMVNCTIHTSYNKGINIDDCSPRIVGCYIEDASANGIYIEGKSNPHVYNNELIDNENGIYLLNNLEEYTVSGSYPDWVQVHSNTEIQDNSFITVEPTINVLFDSALLASGTTVEYSGANCGIWGDNGKPVAGVKDGIGYVTGYEKGSKDLGEAGGIQFEIVPCDKSNRTVGLEYFDHYQDFDYDGLTSLSEWFWSNYTFFHNGKEMRYGNLSSSEWDTDGDMLSDSWEKRYGFNLCDKNDVNDDLSDQDGIITRKEFCLNPNPIPFIRSFDDGLSISFTYIQKPDMYEWGAQPDRKDIFVEVDWMEDHETGCFDGLRFWPHTEHFELKTKAKDSVVLAFYRACRLEIFITLHIDDGCMGGGGDKITFDSRMSNSEADGHYNSYFRDQSPSRKGIFHWTMICHKFKTEVISGTQINADTTAGYAWPSGDTFLIADGAEHNQARNFMHELGHNLDLEHTDVDGNYDGKNDGNDEVPDDADSAMNEDERHWVNYHHIEWGALDFEISYYSSNAIY